MGKRELGNLLAPVNRRTASERWYWPNGTGTLTTGSPSAGTMLLTPLNTNTLGTINGLAWEVTTQGVSVSGTDELRMGLYADDGTGLPTGAALFDSGAQNLEVSTGVKTLAVSWTGLTSKLYWLARVRQTTGSIGTAAQLRISTFNDVSAVYMADSNATPAIGANAPSAFQQTGVTGALPTIASLAVSILGPSIILVKYA